MSVTKQVIIKFNLPYPRFKIKKGRSEGVYFNNPRELTAVSTKSEAQAKDFLSGYLQDAFSEAEKAGLLPAKEGDYYEDYDKAQQRLIAAQDQLRRVEDVLASAYIRSSVPRSYVVVAKIADDIDPSGALFGRVREKAMEAESHGAR